MSERLSSVEKAVARLAGLRRGTEARTAPYDQEVPPGENVGVDPALASDPIFPPVVKMAAQETGRKSEKVALDIEAMRGAGFVTGSAERSTTAEEFRIIKRPLLVKAFATGKDNIRHGNLVMVTSARPGEGKTFCSLNLAMSIALERDLTVMLVDADVVKPGIPAVLGIEARRGLTDLLTDDGLDLSEVLLRTNIDKLTVLPAGEPHLLATELLASERMERLVDEIAERYSDRVVIFDSPPVLMSSVPGVLASHVGQIVFVVQAEKSSASSVDSALGLISGCSHISLVLNRAREVSGADRLYGYYNYDR